MINLSEIKSSHTATALLFLAGLFAPGVATMWTFQPELFVALDTVKFILWAISISAPVFAVYVTIFIVLYCKRNEDNPHVAAFVVASISNSVFTAASLTACYIFKLQLCVHVIIQLLIIIPAFCLVSKYPREKKAENSVKAGR